MLIEFAKQKILNSNSQYENNIENIQLITIFKKSLISQQSIEL